jgi:hypothetical protein
MAIPQSSFIAVMGVVKRRLRILPEIGGKLKMEIARMPACHPLEF